VDTGIHFEQYRASLVQDSYQGFPEYVEQSFVGGESAIAILKKAVDTAVTGIRGGREDVYWEGVCLHQKTLLELHERRVSELLPPETTDVFEVLDFIHSHGWRRFRFCKRLLHMERMVGGARWIWSILPSYRQDNLEKLRDFLCFEENHIAFDALEMEALMVYASREQLEVVMAEKKDGLARSQHILQGNKAFPRFTKLDLGRVNSAVRVSDWTLPLRS
jgi:hypothetical protein